MSRDQRGDSLLHLAIDNACNDIGLLKLLLRAGVDVEAENAVSPKMLHFLSHTPFIEFRFRF